MTVYPLPTALLVRLRGLRCSLRKGDYRLHSANLDVGEAEARALREYYHYRWAIESAYADYKKNFLPSTRSTELGLRTYLYLFTQNTNTNIRSIRGGS